MKKTIKLIIALVAVIGFSFAACDNGSTSSGGKSYSGIAATLSDYPTYEAIFSTTLSVGEFKILNEDNLETKALAAAAADEDNDPAMASNLSEIDYILDMCIGYSVIDSTEKSTILNELNSKGACVGVARRIGKVVVLAFKED
ncbi:MAG: hypothetical protein FWG07_11625 [Treponema sp.]|nr:hypothetical protein [Treponema sp.]